MNEIMKVCSSQFSGGPALFNFLARCWLRLVFVFNSCYSGDAKIIAGVAIWGHWCHERCRYLLASSGCWREPSRCLRLGTNLHLSVLHDAFSVVWLFASTCRAWLLLLWPTLFRPPRWGSVFPWGRTLRRIPGRNSGHFELQIQAVISMMCLPCYWL